MQILIGNNLKYFSSYLEERYRVGLVFPFQNVFYFYFPLFSFLYFIHFCILLNSMNRPVLYCITARILWRSHEVFFLEFFFFFLHKMP